MNSSGAPDFTLFSSPNSYAGNGSTASFTISSEWAPLAPQTNPGTISLACQGEAPLTCSFSPATIDVPGVTGATTTSTLTVGNLPAILGKAVNFTATGTAGGQTYSRPLSVAVPDFSLAAAPSSAGVTPGQSASYTISGNSTQGFNGEINFVCTGAPAAAACTVSPNYVFFTGAEPFKATVTVTTTAPSLLPPAPAPAPTDVPLGPWFTALALFLLAAALAAAAFPLWRATTHAPRRSVSAAAVFLLAVTVALCASCGGGGNGGGSGGGGRSTNNPGTPTGNYTLTITAPSGALTHKATVTLNVQ